MASVAGSSIASLGMALSGDVDRQLRAIRNRTTTMGVNQCVVNEGMPYFNAWVNAEGNRSELDKDSLASGYTLDSWGGTIGFDVDVNPSLTLGLAVTAMYGDVTVDGPDKLDGDMDTTYISAFARYSKRAWTHTFIATVGKMDASVDRTVSHSAGRYSTKGETDGMSFGFLYEVGRTFALDDDGDAAAQLIANLAYRHTNVGGYTETGSDAALKVDDLTMNTITLGVGGRVQAVVGENLFNRTSVLEARALAKADLGDRSSEADVALLNGKGKGTVESAELGAFGVELGAGLSIPLGDEDAGTLFFDVSAELRSGYTNVNGTVGYRINF
jgi:outer membrane autotransporter protein